MRDRQIPTGYQHWYVPTYLLTHWFWKHWKNWFWYINCGSQKYEVVKKLDGEPSILSWKPLIFNVSEITGMDSSLIMSFFAKNQSRGFFKHSKNHLILPLNLQPKVSKSDSHFIWQPCKLWWWSVQGTMLHIVRKSWQEQKTVQTSRKKKTQFA
jgi:hypothetical protein